MDNSKVRFWQGFSVALTLALAARGETPARARARGEFAARLVGDTAKRTSLRCLRGSRRETPLRSHGQHVRPSVA